MEHEIFIPTLSHWEYGNEWSGERGRARFLVTPADGQMTAEIWLGPMCHDLGTVEFQAQFPISEEGIQAMTAWLLEKTDQLNSRASERKDKKN